ncbi:hypothetical protein ABFZ85_13635 [Hyphococcus formosus]|uniref:hypothetical protein n=1 Tax=Hyphococcus formosus TaxID=3143534 RepID=UPI00398AD710
MGISGTPDNQVGSAETTKGLALTGLVIGLLTGGISYGIGEYWIDDHDERFLAFTTLLFIVTTAFSYLLLTEAGQIARAGLGAFFIGVIMTGPDYFIFSTLAVETDNYDPFPGMFWLFVGRGLAVFLLIVLLKARFERGSSLFAFPFYKDVFFHGLTLPLITGGAKLFAGLSLLLLFAWAYLLKQMDVDFFHRLFKEGWFLLPFLGAIGGLSIALMRSQQSVLNALRYVLLLFCRILMVITALFTITLLLVLATKGVGVVFDRPYPSIWMMVLAIAGMLIFNGVYQNGQGAAPPIWLRLPTLITLLGFPVYSGLAFYAFGLRIDDYGLTPPRLTGLVINGLVAAYSFVCLAGLVTELNWRGKKWMPLVGRLNILMACLWVIVLVGLASPIANPWAISAQSQYKLIAEQKISADDFDYGYLRFKLGRPGDRALEKLLKLDNHPEAAAIRDGVSRARSAESYYRYKTPIVPELQEAN